MYNAKPHQPRPLASKCVDLNFRARCPYQKRSVVKVLFPKKHLWTTVRRQTYWLIPILIPDPRGLDKCLCTLLSPKDVQVDPWQDSETREPVMRDKVLVDTRKSLAIIISSNCYKPLCRGTWKVPALRSVVDANSSTYWDGLHTLFFSLATNPVDLSCFLTDSKILQASAKPCSHQRHHSGT